MNRTFIQITLALTLLAALLSSCSKQPVPVPQRPGHDIEDQQPAGISLSFQSPQGTQLAADSASIWLEDAQGRSREARVKLQTKQDQPGTGLLQLPAGDYRINYVLLLNAQGKAVYATPRQQSARATEVARPLPLAGSAAPKAAPLMLQVLPIGAGAQQAVQFGYPAELFQSQQMIRVQLQVGIQIGQVRYDYWEAPLEITWYDAQNQPHVQQWQLPATVYGLHQIGLPAEGTRFVLRLSKWGQTFEKTLLANQLHPDLLIELQGQIAPRQLTEEYTWQEVQGEYRPYSRKLYQYDAAGRVVKTMYYQKIPQKPDLQLQSIEEITYLQGDRIGSIYYSNGNQERTGYLHFLYDVNGRLQNMEQRTPAGTTYAAVEYRSIDTRQEVSIDYLFDNGHAMEYKFVMQHGNKISEGGISSTGGSESSKFNYDQHINPFHLMGLQDIYLRHSSRNNKVGEDRKYGGNIPSLVPYHYAYSYDEKGYPTQLITSYKGYHSGDHLYRAKTQYTYSH